MQKDPAIPLNRNSVVFHENFYKKVHLLTIISALVKISYLKNSVNIVLAVPRITTPQEESTCTKCIRAIRPVAPKYNTGDIDEDIEFKHEKSEYRSERRVLVRNLTPSQVVSYAEKFTGQNSINVNIKYIKRNIELKSLYALLMRGACDMKQRDICAFMDNITQSHAARLCLKGMDIVESREEYRDIVRNFMEKKVS